MKTFSRLSLLTLTFLGIALMLVGGTADAQDASLKVIGGESQTALLNTQTTVTFETRGLTAPVSVPLDLTVSGVQVVSVGGAPSTLAPGTPVTANTNAQGLLAVEVIVTGSPAWVNAVWDRQVLRTLQARATLVTYNRPIICVNSPMPCGHADTFNPKVGVKVGDVFEQEIAIKNVPDLASWQMNVVFNPHILEVVSIEEGDFLEIGDPHDETDDVDALFLASEGEGWVPVGAGHGGLSTKVGEGVIAASQARIERGAADQDFSDVKRVGPAHLSGVTGSGTLMKICFRVLEFAEEPLGVHNVQLVNSSGKRISYSIQINDFIVVTHKFPKEDVNRDGYVNIQDLVLVASNIGLVPGNLHNPQADTNGDGNYGEGDGVRSGLYTEFQPADNPIVPDLASIGDSHSRVDVNNDGIVNVLDLILVAMSPDWGGASTLAKVRDANVASLPAPSMVAENLTPATIQAWIDLAQVEHDGSAAFDVGIQNLQNLLVARIPSETKLLLNYPNPFNPETWIPYQLAKATEVTVTIHSMNGSLIRTIELGHQAAGTYQSKSQAAYWDGRNEFGEQVASGLYFYTLTAGDFSATAKMLVRK